MGKMLIVMLASTLLLLSLLNVVFSDPNLPSTSIKESIYWWIFEATAQGTMHIEMRITLSENYLRLNSWNLYIDKDLAEKIEQIEAYRVPLTKKMKVVSEERRDDVAYNFEYDEPLKSGKDVEFIIEIDLVNASAEILEEIEYLKWDWGTNENFIIHRIDIILPPKIELFPTSVGPWETFEKGKSVVLICNPPADSKNIPIPVYRRTWLDDFTPPQSNFILFSFNFQFEAILSIWTLTSGMSHCKAPLPSYFLTYANPTYLDVSHQSAVGVQFLISWDRY
jgi:hypothetical protein